MWVYEINGFLDNLCDGICIFDWICVCMCLCNDLVIIVVFGYWVCVFEGIYVDKYVICFVWEEKWNFRGDSGGY